MTATPHLAVAVATGLWCSNLAGGLVAYKSPSLCLAVQAGTALIAGTVSHFVLDAIPHNDDIYNTFLGTGPVLTVELAIITSIIFSICYFKELPFLIVFLSFVGGAWPDFFSMYGEGLVGKNQLMTMVNDFHGFCHHPYKPALIPSMIFQELMAIVALGYVLYFRA